MTTTPLNPEPEIVIVTPTLKAYGEFFAVAVIMLIYDVGVSLIVVLAILWHRYRLRYRVTADSIIFERGLIMRSSETLPILKIKEIIVKQGPVQQQLNIGSLRILHADPSLPAMNIKGIPYPEDLKAVIARNVRRLREARAERAALENPPTA